MGDAFLINRGNIDAHGRLPMIKYTGKYDLFDEGVSGETRNWSISFGTSGEFITADDMEIEVVFLINGQQPSAPIKQSLKARTAYNVVTGNVSQLGFGPMSRYGGGAVKIRNAR